VARTTNLFHKANSRGVPKNNLWILRDHHCLITTHARGIISEEPEKEFSN